PGLRAMVQRGLQKPPARRFQSASDFAFALRLSGAVPAAPVARFRGMRMIGLVLATLVLAVTAIAVAMRAGRSATPPAPDARLQRITFQPGRVWSARFVPGSD